MAKRSHDSMSSDQMQMAVLGTKVFGRNNLQFMQHPKPAACTLRPTEVLVRVLYSDLNPVDHHKLNMKADGAAVPDHRSPFVVGFGGCGVVEAVAADTADDAAKSLLNARVVFLADPSRDGSYAEYVVCDRRVVAPVPAGGAIASHEAAAIPVAGCTALESLEKAGLAISSAEAPQPSAGEGRRLLIVGAAGGVGSWATQLARSNYPQLDIVGTASSPESSAWCEAMGCTSIIGHDEVESLGGGRDGSVDHILCLSEPTPKLFASLAEVLRPYGKIVLVVSGEGIKSLDLSFVFFKCGTVSTETVFTSMRDGYRLDQAGQLDTILSLLDQRRAKAPISKDWEDERSGWKVANERGGYIDAVGSGRSRGILVMKILS